jgi:hypothetical protein
MNVVIINCTINLTNTEIKKFSTKISRGDNKNLLYTLPYIDCIFDMLNLNMFFNKNNVYLHWNIFHLF